MMKNLTSIVLVLFMLFLVTPSIVACLENNKQAVSLCEDCGNSPSSSIEEIKHDLKYYTLDTMVDLCFFDNGNNAGGIIFENLSRHDLISGTIFLPPPNMV